MKLVHWPLMGGLLHLTQRRGDWAGPQSAQSPRCTKCNSPHINGQCTSYRIAVQWDIVTFLIIAPYKLLLTYNDPLLCGFNVPIKG